MNNKDIIKYILSDSNALAAEKFAVACRVMLLLSVSDRAAAYEFVKAQNVFLQKVGYVAPKEMAIFITKYANDPEIYNPFLKHALIDKNISPINQGANPNDINNLEKELAEQLDQLFDGRTQLMFQHNAAVQLASEDRDKKELFIKIHGTKIPCVTRYIRNFNQRLCSAGSAMGREYILLNPESESLQHAYNELKNLLINAHGKEIPPVVLLEAINSYTRKLFPSVNVESIVADESNTISLGAFLRRGAGVCRHHSLLNCYFLSRLKEDNLVEGDVIHHRQNVRNGAHTWVILKTTTATYSLDSLHNDFHCIEDNPGRLDRKWGLNTEAAIKKRYPAPVIEIPPADAGNNQEQNDQRIINAFIRNYKGRLGKSWDKDHTPTLQDIADHLNATYSAYNATKIHGFFSLAKKGIATRKALQKIMSNIDCDNGKISADDIRNNCKPNL